MFARHPYGVARPPLRRRQALRSLRGLIAFLWTGRLMNVADHDMRAYIGKLHEWIQRNLAETQKLREDTADPEIR